MDRETNPMDPAPSREFDREIVDVSWDKKEIEEPESSLESDLQILPRDWKQTNWGAREANKILRNIYGSGKWDIPKIVTNNIHYSELPELLRTNVPNMGRYLEGIALDRQSKSHPDWFIGPRSDLYAKWDEIGEVKSDETNRSLKMNISPQDLYEMAKSLKRICTRLNAMHDSEKGLTTLIIADMLKVLMNWIPPSTRTRWGVRVPACWGTSECTAADIAEFCIRLLQGLRRDQVHSIIEHFSLGSGFGSRKKGAFDVEELANVFIESIEPDVLDETIFTSDITNLEQIYKDLTLKAFPAPSSPSRASPGNEPAYAKNGMQCYPPGTQCSWPISSYIPWLGKPECGCYDHIGNWNACEDEKCN